MTTDTVGGVWTYALSLARALRPRGVDVVLATMGPCATPQQRADAADVVVELRESAYRLEWMEDPWADVGAAGEWLLDLADEFRPDVVHLNGYAHASLPWGAPVLVGAHSCVLSWWRSVRGTEAPAGWNEYRRRLRIGLNAADVTVFPTAALLNAMQAEHGRIPRARVVYNGLDGLIPECPMKEPFVLATGRFWDEGKNLSVLQDVGARVRWPLYVAGECDHAGERGRPHGVISLGRLEREELYRWQTRATIAVHPARYEPFGYGPLEAARAHCALVLSDIPSLRELWDGAALFAEPDDVAGLAATINRLIAEPATLAVLRARAARRAQQFTEERMAAGYADIYREIVSPADGQRRIACAS